MKKSILFLFVAFAATAHSQNLKDLLFSGKLKSDSGSVVRSSDDLKSKIDTSKKKTVVQTTSTTKVDVTKTQNPSNVDATKKNDAAIIPVSNQTNDAPTTTTPAQQTATPVKSNTRLWKEYSDALSVGLKDVLSSRKIKKDSYYFMVEYEISTEGVTTINNITVSPDNAILLDQVKQRITDSPPQLNPVLDSNNKPQKVKKRYNFYITKE